MEGNKSTVWMQYNAILLSLWILYLWFDLFWFEWYCMMVYDNIVCITLEKKNLASSDGYMSNTGDVSLKPKLAASSIVRYEFASLSFTSITEWLKWEF